MLINVLKKHAVFGFVFTIAKATVYLIPLLLADILSQADFGVLEYALAGLGMIVNTVINLGIPGAYPYFILKENRPDLKPTFSLHALILIIPFLINQILFFVFNLDVNFYLAFNISYIIANQVYYSTQLKSHEKSSLGVIFDSGIYIVLLLFIIAYYSNLILPTIQAINVFIFIYSLLYVVYAIKKYNDHKVNSSFKAYKTILKFSIHILISTFLIFLITTSGRIFVEFFFDFKTVGVYAFYFRLAAIVVMIHQVINIAFFKKIYTFNSKILDTYYFLFFVFIFVLSIIIYFISPLFVGYFSEFFNKTYGANRDLYFLLSAQMVFWISSALNSVIIDRENLAFQNNIQLVILICASALILYVLKNDLTLALLVYYHLTVIFLTCLIQYYTLYRRKIYFLKSILSLTLIYFIINMVYFLNF